MWRRSMSASVGIGSPGPGAPDGAGVVDPDAWGQADRPPRPTAGKLDDHLVRREAPRLRKAGRRARGCRDRTGGEQAEEGSDDRNATAHAQFVELSTNTGAPAKL